MKDYSMGADGNFILNYEIKDNMIITKHPTNENFLKTIINKILKKNIIKLKCYEYSQEKEIDILKQMKNQLLNKNYIKAEKVYLDSCYDDFKLNLLRTCVLLLISSFFIGTTLPITLLILSVVYFGLTLKDLASYFYTKRNIRIIEEDFLKSELFLENEIKLNNKIRDNQDILKYSSFKVNELVKSRKLKEDVFTINTIHNISCEDLIDLIDSIEIIESLEEISNEESKTEKRKKFVKDQL